MGSAYGLMEKLKIALLSDFHYGFPEEEDMEEYIESIIEEMVEEINKESQDLVVALGDFTQHSDHKTGLHS